MKNQQTVSTPNGWLGTGILAAIGASLCCITPVLAMIGGISGIASSFSWLEPLRPFLIGLTGLALAFAWYKKLKPNNQADCACDTDPKPTFMQSKKFLLIITVFAIVMLAFPSYAHVFYPQDQGNKAILGKNTQQVELTVKGMTCSGCESHVNNEVNKLEGIFEVKTSYEKGKTVVKFDKDKTTIKQIEAAVNATGYQVTNIKQR
ncbi:mercuric transport protein MerTP [Pontibacter sp. MBLB2868]|uniref:mercuric transport protein MerTP n=1 Tax=Pontibacter sp. MBLB2868 TaxID=3451555 RepID=UPI003F74E175